MVGQVSHSFSLTFAEVAGQNWVGPNEWNSLHSVNLTVTGSTLGQSTVSGTNIELGASQNLTASISTAAGGQTMWFVGPQLSAWSVGEGATTSYDATSLAASSASIFGCMFILPTEMAISHLDIFGSQSLAVSISGGTTSKSASASTTGQTWLLIGLYSRQGGANSGTLTLLSSTSNEIQYSLSVSESSTSWSNTMSVTYTTGIPQASISATYSGTTVSTTATNTLTAGNTASWAANAFDLPLPFAGTLEPGEYFVGMNLVTSGANTIGPRLSISYFKAVGSMSMGYLGQGNAAVPGGEYVQGMAMTNGSSNAMPASYPLSSLKPHSLGQPWVHMVNYATNTNLL